MIDVAEAIDDEAELVTWTRYAAGTTDGKGNYIKGAATTLDIAAAIQPSSGRQMKDLPEGLIKEVAYVGWSRSTVAVNHEIGYGGENFRVVWAWPRPKDGFTKFALRKIA